MAQAEREDVPAGVQALEAEEILQERCDYIYRRVLPAIAATAALSLLLSVFLWRSRPTELILFWQAVILTISAGLWGLSEAYRRTPQARAQAPLWIRRLAFGAAVLGAGWGYAAAVFFPGREDEQVFIAFVVALITAGGLPMFSTIWWIYAIYAAAEMVGRNGITMLFGAEDRGTTEKWWTRFVAEGKPQTVVAEHCVRRDGLELTCEWTLTPLVNDDGEVTSIVLQGRDITQQRAAERMRSEFTSTLSHELRTPLTSILGSLQLLRSGALGDMDKDQGELVEVAERNGQRLLDLINEVLDIEKIDSGRVTLVPETIALEQLVRESLQLNQGYADRFQVRLALAGELPALDVRADRKRLMQVMTNLLSNAAKFSPPGATVEVRLRPSGDMRRVAVSD